MVGFSNKNLINPLEWLIASFNVAAGITLANIMILITKRKMVTPTSNTRPAIIKGF